MITRHFTFLLILSALLAACAPQPAPVPTEIPATETPPIVSTIPAQPPVDIQSIPTSEQPVANNAWVQYRDPRYGLA